MSDARMRELEFLTRIEREGGVKANILDGGLLRDPAMRQMILHLLYEGHLNGLDNVIMPSRLEPIPWREARDKLETRRWNDLTAVLSKQEVILYLSHKGRVRISELRDALNAGRYHDPSGLLWSKRHFDRDFAVALLGASKADPLSLAMFDMNGLKGINDSHGHDAGDQVIRAYLHAVAMFTGDGIDGYRGDGGDEVYLMLRSTNDPDARKVIDSLLAKLAGERILLGDGNEIVGLTACCGFVTIVDPGASPATLTKTADERLYAAKAASRAPAKKKGGKARESIVVGGEL